MFRTEITELGTGKTFCSVENLCKTILLIQLFHLAST